MSGNQGPGGKTVLVVEDNPGDAHLVSLYLREETRVPFHVLQASRLSEALVCLAVTPVDVVLLDLSLPDSFGLDTLARLRDAHPAIPVVVLTGTNDEALALDALRQGAQDYLVKGEGGSDLVRRAVRYAIERSRVDQELRRSEAQFRAVFANAGIGVVLTAPPGRILEANPAFAAMLGYDVAELKAMTITQVTFPEDVEDNNNLFAEMSSGKRDNYWMEKRYLSKDGRVMWGTLTVTAVRDDDGCLRFAVAVIEDITERKRLEGHMRLAATVFENTGEALFITDAARRIIQVNRASTAITGYEPADVLGHTPNVLSSGRHGADFYAAMAEALQSRGAWQGEIWDRHKSGEMFVGWQSIAAVRGPDGKIANYVAVISDITTRKQLEERLSYAANHDPLTRLPNRTLFHERLSRALARAHRNHNLVALLFIDLDHFKQVNDSLGHLAGDLLLQQVSERIGGAIRQGDTVARLAGDEFTVILEDIQDPRDAAIVGHKILHLLAEPFQLKTNAATISSSIGVAIYPSDGEDEQTLVKLADSAMYRAKNMGRNSCQFHSEAINAQAFERLVLEEGLRFALSRGEFEIHYQPLFDLVTGRVAAIEALLRWRHPQLGLVVPTQFLPLTEEAGLILAIGSWVLATACDQMTRWHEMGFADLQLNVNLSARQLRESQLIERVAEVLEGSGMAPEKLVLEVPESTVLDQGNEPSGAFFRLGALGVHLAIDEFGAGYSSFTFLRLLPTNCLKICQAFVRNIAASVDDAEIVTAIVAVAHGLHMSVVAPGVETEEQLALLASYGCNRVQGFLLARPMMADAMTAFLQQGEIPAALAKRMMP